MSASDIQHAIDSTSQGNTSTLDVPPGTRIALEGAAIIITGIRVVLSSRAEGAIIDGDRRSRIFTLFAGAALELTGISCTNGRAGGLGTLPVEAAGGAFFVANGSSITLVGAHVSNCTSGRPGDTLVRALRSQIACPLFSHVMIE